MTSSTHRLLTAWEEARGLTPARRALALAAIVAPDRARTELAQITVGERDEALLRLRRAAFGTAVAAATSCPSCDERVEVSFDLDDVLALDAGGAGERAALPPLRIDDWTITFRLPTGDDLVQIENCTSAEEAQSRLLELCAEEVRESERPAPVASIPDEVIDALDDALAAADEQADIQLGVVCPECGTEWRQVFDISTFLWTELDSWARRLLSEVHVLARAYGWSEPQILGLSPLRRRAYLEMVAA